MIIKCAWCGKYLGEKEPYDDKSVTHGICQKCKAKMEAEEDEDDLCPTPELAEYVYTDDSVMTPYGRFGPGFDSHNPPWRGRVDRF